VARAYRGETPTFGPGYPHPSPFDPRLILRIAPAVAKAAMETGVATRPITDFEAYVEAAQPLRLPLRPRDEAGVRRAQGAQRPSA
jgi:malic enzyme